MNAALATMSGTVGPDGSARLEQLARHLVPAGEAVFFQVLVRDTVSRRAFLSQVVAHYVQ